MADNISATHSNEMGIGLYVTIGVSSISVIISTAACLLIVFLFLTMPRFHSPTYLLVSNTCLSTLTYLLIATVNSVLLYLQSASSDWSCRIRAYLYYVSLNLVIDSYVIQAISRLFWTVLYQHRHLLTMKYHIGLIVMEVGIAFLLPLASIITDHVVFRPFKLCLVAMKHRAHVLYLLLIGYIFPLLAIIILYAVIYRHIAHSTGNFRRRTRGAKRDATLARNILILVGIFILGGLPTVIYIIISNSTQSAPTGLFILAVTTPSTAIAVEKIATILLNKEIRNALQGQWTRWFPNCHFGPSRVRPFTMTHTADRRTTLLAAARAHGDHDVRI